MAVLSLWTRNDPPERVVFHGPGGYPGPRGERRWREPGFVGILRRVSYENVETVRRLFELFQTAMERGDLGSWTESEDLAHDFEWIPPRDVPGFGTCRGQEGFLEFMRTWTEEFDSWSVELEQAFDGARGRVAGIVRQRAIGKSSTAPVELRQGMVWEFEQGRVIRIRHFLSPTEALEAAGLSE